VKLRLGIHPISAPAFTQASGLRLRDILLLGIGERRSFTCSNSPHRHCPAQTFACPRSAGELNPRERSQLTVPGTQRTGRPRLASGISCTARSSGLRLGFGQTEWS